ncbi:MAG: hypothetical protein H6581_10650 [Bacteroidia bacterium]|nr:hypothetical protein [Bacteroidia bacterium]
MKKILFSLSLLILIAQTSFADAWDALTPEQAEEVVTYLIRNPFILDYCDCCDNGDVYLLKVLRADIVPCSWDDEKKSVVVQAVQIGQLERNGSYPSAYRCQPLNEKVEYTITMNYTFVYSACGNWAVPFFKEVAYPENHVCAGATRFPDPAENDIQDRDYKAWFEKTGM